MGIAERLLGPRVPKEELEKDAAIYRRPKILFGVAALVLLISIFLPYWHLNMEAPQFPDGLSVKAYVNRLEGHVNELDELNHYVGLPSLEDGAALERSVSLIAIIVLAGLVLASLYIHSRYVVLFVLPALLFPFIFMGDLQFWLWRYGHSLDPRAALTGAVGEFTPPLFGPADIAQFHTIALPGLGFILAVVASILVAVGLWFHRQAYKPLVEGTVEAKDQEPADETGAETEIGTSRSS